MSATVAHACNAWSMVRPQGKAKSTKVDKKKTNNSKAAKKDRN